MRMAICLSEQGTCVRRQVGAIFVNRHNHIIASGYNGVAAGLEHCIDSPCAGSCGAHGTDLHACEAIHAEQNALMQCKDVHDISIAYITTSPCLHCIKMLLNTSCKTIYYASKYEAHFDAVEAIWTKAGREILPI